MRPFGRRILLAFVGLCLALAAAEIGLRLFDRFPPPETQPVERHPDLYRADPVLGYTLWPSKRVMYNYPRWSSNRFELASNSDGFRNPREFDEPDPRPRIWMLGVSMVLGDGVVAENRLTEVIERLEPGWRVDNMGMTGWGVDLMLRAFEHVSRRVQPNVVILGFYTDDFRRLNPFNVGVGYAYPKFELRGGTLRSVPFPTLPAWRRLRVVQAVEQSYWRLVSDQFDLHAALLDRLNRGVREHGGDLVIVFLPGRFDRDHDRQRRGWLRAWCAQADVPFADLTETLLSVGRDVTHIRGNEHWNDRGHQVAGEAIRKFLREIGLPRD